MSTVQIRWVDNNSLSVYHFENYIKDDRED